MLNFCIIPFCIMSMPGGGESFPDHGTEVPNMETMLQGMTWKEIFTDLVKDFTAWGCRYSKKKLPEIAMGYDCTPLFFWNWLDDPETEKTEKGFLRVLGYAWRKYLESQEADSVPKPVKALALPVNAPAGKAA